MQISYKKNNLKKSLMQTFFNLKYITIFKKKILFEIEMK